MWIGPGFCVVACGSVLVYHHVELIEMEDGGLLAWCSGEALKRGKSHPSWGTGVPEIATGIFEGHYRRCFDSVDRKDVGHLQRGPSARNAVRRCRGNHVDKKQTTAFLFDI